MATSDMTARDVAALKVKQDRLMGDIHSTCEWGKGEAWGKYVSFYFVSSFSIHSLLFLT